MLADSPSQGQLNVIHTTDTHGWLEGHILEKNYGADWGDFVSFTKGVGISESSMSRLTIDVDS